MPAGSGDTVRVGVNLTFLDSDQPSGTGVYAWSLVGELAEQPDLDLVLYTAGATVPKDLVGRVQVVAHRPFRSVLTRIAWEQTVLALQARRHRLQVLLNPGYVCPVLGPTPKITTVHDLYYARCPEALTRFRRLYYRIGTTMSCRASRAVIAVSATTGADLAELVAGSRNKITVIHEAVRPGLLQAALEVSGAAVSGAEVSGAEVSGADPPGPGLAALRAPYFLIVASVTRNKNIDTVAASLRQLNGTRAQPAQVAVIGSDPYGLLAEATARYGDPGSLVALGGVSDQQLVRAYRGAVAAIQPSAYEGFGLPALEAQALGVPLICSRGGALPEVVGEAAQFFDHRDPASLAAAMTVLLDDHHRRQQLRDAGLVNAGRYSWAAAGTATATLIRQVARS
ncbi:MAG: glycosyltransferase family 4 protein [Acidimicrobiales bacterium]